MTDYSRDWTCIITICCLHVHLTTCSTVSRAQWKQFSNTIRTWIPLGLKNPAPTAENNHSEPDSNQGPPATLPHSYGESFQQYQPALFQCSQGDKPFSRWDLLMRHMWVIHGEILHLHRRIVGPFKFQCNPIYPVVDICASMKRNTNKSSVKLSSFYGTL